MLTEQDLQEYVGEIRVHTCAGLLEESKVGIEEVYRAYEEGTGLWTGCDWPTRFGATGLDLNGYAAAEADAIAIDAIRTEAAEDWSSAAHWLARVERCAGKAEVQAALAVKAAVAGQWDEALDHADRAWVLEFSTGRPLHKGESAWKGLCRAIENASLVCRQITTGECKHGNDPRYSCSQGPAGSVRQARNLRA
jgi:hypothetical protein